MKCTKQKEMEVLGKHWFKLELQRAIFSKIRLEIQKKKLNEIQKCWNRVLGKQSPQWLTATPNCHAAFFRPPENDRMGESCRCLKGGCLSSTNQHISEVTKKVINRMKLNKGTEGNQPWKLLQHDWGFCHCRKHQHWTTLPPLPMTVKWSPPQ